jgi:hypothetical protein
MADDSPPTLYCTYCNITIRKSYKSTHEKTKKHLIACMNNPTIKEQRKMRVEERFEKNERLIEILNKLSIQERRFIYENQKEFIDAVHIASM